MRYFLTLNGDNDAEPVDLTRDQAIEKLGGMIDELDDLCTAAMIDSRGKREDRADRDLGSVTLTVVHTRSVYTRSWLPKRSMWAS